MCDKKYEHPLFTIWDDKIDIIVMSGTGFDMDDCDIHITDIDWLGGAEK